MNPPPSQSSASPPWFLILGLLAGVAFVAYIVWDSAKPPPGVASSSNVVELTLANWQKEVVESDIPVFVDFTATWCPPCQRFAPVVNRLADKYKGKIKVAKFDMGDKTFSKGRKLADQYGINGIPHVLIFKGGEQPIREYSGGASEGELARVFDSLLTSR